MPTKTVTATPTKTQDSTLVLLLAFFAVYVLWGTTFLAIRVAVAEIPPLLAAGVRFFVAGILLYGFMHLRGATPPTREQWRNLSLLGVLMFVTVYGPLFWAEKYIPSGVASILEATIPLITIVLEVLVFRQQPFRLRALLSASLGFFGVGVLLFPSGPERLSLMPCLAILAGAVSWCSGSVLNRSLSLPKSKPLIAGAEMMLGGFILLVLSAASGELATRPAFSLRAGAALVYLIVFGSLLGFTAFVWLLARMPATRVASHAYVNPVVAVALGYFMLGEVITARTLIGAGIVLISVFTILSDRTAKSVAS